LAGVPIRGRDTVRTRRVLEWHGFDHSEIVAYVCGQADPQIEALADRLLGIGAAPPAPMPVAVKHLLSHLPMERDALRVRARAALAQSGWDPAAIDRALDGAADTAGTVAAANALDRHGWPAGDVLAALPGLAVLAVPA
jgi:hypothetical protein